jgi:hypothetical protein
MKRVLFVCLVLAGCGSEQSTPQSQDRAQAISTNYGYGWSVDDESPSGLRVRYLNDGTPRIAVVEHEYDRVLDCVITHYYPAFSRDIARPLFIFLPGPPQANDGGLSLPLTNTEVVDGDNSIEMQLVIVRHESVHQILRANGFPEDKNFNHESPAFDNTADGEGCVLETQSRLAR